MKEKAMQQADIEAFWADFEREIGDEVIAKTMGQHFTSRKAQGEWGLLVLTASTIRFRPTPGENWFQSLFKMATPKVPKEPQEDIVVPLSAITAIELPKSASWTFFLAPPFTVFTVHYRLDEKELTVLLGADPKSEVIEKLKWASPIANEH